MAGVFKVEPAALRGVAEQLSAVSSQMEQKVSPVRALVDGAGEQACAMKPGDYDDLLAQIHHLVESVAPYKTTLLNQYSDAMRQTADVSEASDDA
jgi:hypothetical protein